MKNYIWHNPKVQLKKKNRLGKILWRYMPTPQRRRCICNAAEDNLNHRLSISCETINNTNSPPFHPTETQETRKAREAGTEARNQADHTLILSRDKHFAVRRSLKQTSVRSDLLRELCERLREGGNPHLKTFCSVPGSVGPFFTQQFVSWDYTRCRSRAVKLSIKILAFSGLILRKKRSGFEDKKKIMNNKSINGVLCILLVVICLI